MPVLIYARSDLDHNCLPLSLRMLWTSHRWFSIEAHTGIFQHSNTNDRVGFLIALLIFYFQADLDSAAEEFGGALVGLCQALDALVELANSVGNQKRSWETILEGLGGICTDVQTALEADMGSAKRGMVSFVLSYHCILQLVLSMFYARSCMLMEYSLIRLICISFYKKYLRRSRSACAHKMFAVLLYKHPSAFIDCFKTLITEACVYRINQ